MESLYHASGTAHVNAQSGHVAGVNSDRPIRRLAAILVADVAGYSRLIDQDELRTQTRLRALQAQVIEPEIALHDGRIIRLAGDGMLVIFPSATGALFCAIGMQRAIAERGRFVPPRQRMLLRVGLNVADILVDDREIAGNGVDLAARLEALAEPGGICLSRALKDQIHENVGVEFLDAGAHRVKNISRPVRVFHVLAGARRPAWARMRVTLGRVALSPFLPLLAGGIGAVLSALLVGHLHIASPDPTFIRILTPAPDADGVSDDVRIELSIAVEPNGNSHSLKVTAPGLHASGISGSASTASRSETRSPLSAIE